MIVEMKKLTLLCLEDDTSTTLDALRDLGVLHMTPVKPPDDLDIRQNAADTQEARSIQLALRTYRKRAATAAASPAAVDPSTLLATARDLLGRKQKVVDRIEALRRERTAVEPYGDFDPSAVTRLREKGVTVRLYHTTTRKPIEVPEGTCVQVLRADTRGQYLAVIGRGDFDVEATELPIPERSLSEVSAELAELAETLNRIEDELAALSREDAALQVIIAELEDRAAYIRARDGMGTARPVAYLQGFCPVDRVSLLETTARTHGWGLIVDDPADDDHVPTLIRNPAWVRPINCVFEMLDILPGYSEVDIRSVFLIFFTLFFAILVGDAGYGLIFLALAIAARLKLRHMPREPFRLIILLSVATIVWGMITGNYFGVLHLPAPLRNFEIPWMKDEHNLMAFSFLVGAIHLTVARAWSAVQKINSTRAIAELGWICLTWFMYFLAGHLILGNSLPGWATPLFAVGLALLVLFMTPVRRLKKEWADHIMLPFDVIGNFADLVSYVRLFAVGSAGLAVAIAFNELAIGPGIESVGGAIKASIVLFLGHALNIVLCLMSILVHGVRLNTLEFSRHIGLEWAGFRYEPFTGHARANAGEVASDNR
jgi:V/A-type H+-transporting ATPase subunit I